jgi:hypothetical protein
MNQISENLYKKLEQVSFEVKNNLNRKGIAIPVKNKDGSILIGSYTIKKIHNHYQIRDYSQEIIVDRINLPHSAIMLANGLALGRYLDTDLLTKDRDYGYAAFEEEYHKNIARKHLNKNVDRAELAFTKSAIKKRKKDVHKSDILRSFDKLKRFA